MKEEILRLEDITKIFKLYSDPKDRLIELFFKEKRHEIFYANKNISFSLYKGETLGIIGLNGAGKSTLLKQIAGVLEPTSGQIIRQGRVTALLELGTGFNYELTGRENIFFNGILLGMNKSEIEQKLEKIIEFSELGFFIDEPLKTYSSGMIMRLAFSIAIHTDPQILIVDEALSVGDAYFSAKCTKALKELKEKNLSTIYVSHDLNSLKMLCDRVLLLDRGEIIFEGDPEEVINRYNFLIAKVGDEALQERSDSFGNYDAVIEKVSIHSKESKSSVIASGDEAIVKIYIHSHKDLKDVTVGFMIRDRFGQDIFGTNTFYHGKNIDMKKDQQYIVSFSFPLNIGVGKYSITAALHMHENHLHNCIHWVDGATQFEVAGIKGPLFSGICRLEPIIEIKGYCESR